MTPLASFVHEHLGDVEVVDRPRPSGTTRVVRVRDAAGHEWFAKRLMVEARWRAESSAYDAWAGVPGVLMPRATCERRRCLLLPPAPGRHPSGQSRRVLRGAGRLLRTMHDAPAPTSWASTWRATATARVDRLLADLPRRGVGIDRGLVRALQTELLATTLPEVPTHGDFQPHNWRGHARRLHVIDHESATVRPAAFDVARLRYSTCWHRPELLRSFLMGYGRDLTEAEQRFVVTVLPWRALVAIDLGLRYDRAEMVAHGLTVLDHLGRTEL